LEGFGKDEKKERVKSKGKQVLQRREECIRKCAQCSEQSEPILPGSNSSKRSQNRTYIIEFVIFTFFVPVR
jgi:hypothetical protein